MMKKLLSCALLFGSIGAAFAQSAILRSAPRNLESETMIHTNQTSLPALKTTTLTQTDTLWYFYNKHKFKNTAANQGFYTVQLSTGTTTNGDFVEYGSSFLNTTANSSVTVSEVIILLSRQANSPSASIPVRVYLYKATALGLPTTKVDSVMINVSNTNGTFNIATFASPKTIAGSFFVSYRTMATNTADTLLAWVSSGSTSGNTSSPVNERFGEGLSYIRGVIVPSPSLDQFYVTADFLFGQGYDPEAIVAPVVSYSYAANFNAAAPNSTSTPGSYCTGTPIAFTNVSFPSSIIYNRQFNFNKFITHWAPTTWGNPVTPDPADPIDNWSFSNSANTPTTTNASNTMASAGSFNATLEIKYRHSPFQPNQQTPSVSDIQMKTYNVVNCSTTSTATGISSVGGFENLSVYPNPTVNGKTTISGLNGSNTILIYDMLGQLVSTQVVDKEVASIDLLNKPNGNYIAKIINAGNNIKVVKIINQN
ncbi:MAG: T9SS type A sorting domain-containing protein [Bacteroidota bacterium]